MKNSINTGIIMVTGHLAEFNRYVSNIWVIESMDNHNHNHNLLNNIYLDNLFNFNKYSLILDNSLIGYIFLITIIIWVGILIILSQPFQEGLKTALKIGGVLAAGATMASADNGRDRDEEERKRREEELE